MADRSLTQGWPDDWTGGTYAAREPQRADPFGTDTGRPGAIRHSAAREEAEADRTGFLGALFDFGFTSFVTPKIIKVLYALLMIGAVVSALAFTMVVFKVSAAFGIVTLLFGDPLVILVVMAIYRIILEFFVVTFQIAEDIQRLRERGDLG